MTITQIVRYLENRDASSIGYKQFNQTPRDKYPTFSICFQGAEVNWYYDTLMFNRLGITTAQYELILKGETGLRYDYEYATRLFKKSPLDIRNVSDIGLEQFSLNITDVLVGLEFVTQKPNNAIHYVSGKDGKPVQELPFYIGYQTPETICFTRKSNDELDLIRVHDWLSLPRYLLDDQIYGDVELQLVIHYPGQLLRSLDNPRYKSTLDNYNKVKLLELKISHVTVLRKRPDSNAPCNNEDQDDDTHLLLEIIKHIGCIPIYWKCIVPNNPRFDECKSPEELKEAYHYIKNYKDVLYSYVPPCVDMNLLVMYDKAVDQTDEEFIIKFMYTERYYQEIENVREFGFESFWSAVGGFVGIFLGYSMMQFPALLDNLPALFRKLKNALYND